MTCAIAKACSPKGPEHSLILGCCFLGIFKNLFCTCFLWVKYVSAFFAAPSAHSILDVLSTEFQWAQHMWESVRLTVNARDGSSNYSCARGPLTALQRPCFPLKPELALNAESRQLHYKKHEWPTSCHILSYFCYFCVLASHLCHKWRYTSKGREE